MNKQIILADRPDGLPSASTWTLRTEDIPQMGAGEMIIKIHYVSLDPAMRGWIRDSKSYLPPVDLNTVMRAGTVGQVITSNLPTFSSGDWVVGPGGVQQYVSCTGEGWHKIDNRLPVEKYLSVLGMTGYTAYFGLLDIGQPQPGQTLLVSAAAGAVGSIVGQIGKIYGCHVVGVAGGIEKCDYVTSTLGFDACIDYKGGDVRSEMHKHLDGGIDVYFDNVGGEILDLALTRINKGARIVLCGGISQYNAEGRPVGPSNYLALLVQRARMEGFIVLDYSRRFPEAGEKLTGWFKSGKLRSDEHIERGIENFHPAFLRLFSGSKKGKLILKVDEDA